MSSKLGELLKITEHLKHDVRKKLNTTEADIVENIKSIRMWLRKTPHLPEERSNLWLEIFLLRNKMSLERTKKSLEGYYTAKTGLRDYFENLVPNSMVYQKTKSYTCVVVMPELINDFGRITIHRLSNIDSELYEPLESFSIFSMINEIRLSNDYNYCDVIIVDLGGISLKHIMKFTPKVIKKMRYFIMKTLIINLHSVHLVNVPHYTDKVLPILRSIMPGKVYKKVHVHTTLESLYQFIPKPYLPSDYGGEQSSLIELFGKWCEEIEKCTPYLTEHVNQRTDETKRVGRCHEFEIFGCGSDGSFKQLKNPF